MTLIIETPDTTADAAAASLADAVAAAALADRVAGLGMQLYAAVHGRTVIDRAWGTTQNREPMAPGHLHSGFCVVKPLLGMALGLLIERGSISLDMAVADIIGEQAWVPAGVTLADVVTHQAGLARPYGIEWRMCPPTRRNEFLATLTNEREPAYSEVGAGLVVEAVIFAVTGRRSDDFIDEEIIRPLGLHGEVVVRADDAVSPVIRGRVRVPMVIRPDRCIPFLTERLEAQLAETRPAFGCLVSMRGLGSLFAAFERTLSGVACPGLPSPDTVARLLETRRVPVMDRVLNREGGFAGFFQVGLGDHCISTLASDRAVAHVSGLASCVAIADPVSGVAIATYLNGSILNEAERTERIRTDIIDTLLRGLPLLAGAARGEGTS